MPNISIRINLVSEIWSTFYVLKIYLFFILKPLPITPTATIYLGTYSAMINLWLISDNRNFSDWWRVLTVDDVIEKQV